MFQYERKHGQKLIYWSEWNSGGWMKSGIWFLIAENWLKNILVQCWIDSELDS